MIKQANVRTLIGEREVESVEEALNELDFSLVAVEDVIEGNVDIIQKIAAPRHRPVPADGQLRPNAFEERVRQRKTLASVAWQDRQLPRFFEDVFGPSYGRQRTAGAYSCQQIFCFLFDVAGLQAEIGRAITRDSLAQHLSVFVQDGI